MKTTPRSPRRYEASPKDIQEDRRGAQRLGVTLKQYERTPRDRREDAAGQRRLNQGKKPR